MSDSFLEPHTAYASGCRYPTHAATVMSGTGLARLLGDFVKHIRMPLTWEMRLRRCCVKARRTMSNSRGRRSCGFNSSSCSFGQSRIGHTTIVCADGSPTTSGRARRRNSRRNFSACGVTRARHEKGQPRVPGNQPSNSRTDAKRVFALGYAETARTGAFGQNATVDCTFDRGSVPRTYHKPCDLFAKGAESGGWLAALDDFRNWLIREAA